MTLSGTTSNQSVVVHTYTAVYINCEKPFPSRKITLVKHNNYDDTYCVIRDEDKPLSKQ